MAIIHCQCFPRHYRGRSHARAMPVNSVRFGDIKIQLNPEDMLTERGSSSATDAATMVAEFPRILGAHSMLLAEEEINFQFSGFLWLSTKFA